MGSPFRLTVRCPWNLNWESDWGSSLTGMVL